MWCVGSVYYFPSKPSKITQDGKAQQRAFLRNKGMEWVKEERKGEIDRKSPDRRILRKLEDT